MSNLTPRLNRIDLPEISAPSSDVVLTALSARTQILSPSTNISVTLPDEYSEFKIINRSANIITIRAANTGILLTLISGGAEIVAKTLAPVAAADWYIERANGSYSPTPVNIIGSTVTGLVGRFVKEGNSVTVNFNGSVQASGAGRRQFRFNLPFPMAGSTDNDLSGAGQIYDSTSSPDHRQMYILYSGGEALIDYNALTTLARGFQGVVSYLTTY